ncbi:hypothetical protein CEQ31_026690 [Serratia odorifera]|nr:hypothetical protein CEQ31_026690 [Serratia odorifera]
MLKAIDYLLMSKRNEGGGGVLRRYLNSDELLKAMVSKRHPGLTVSADVSIKVMCRHTTLNRRGKPSGTVRTWTSPSAFWLWGMSMAW